MCQKRNKILSIFCSNLKSRYHLREISKLSKIPLKTTFRYLLELEKKGIMKSKREGRNRYFELNLDNIKTKFLLQETEIYRTLLYLEKYPVFKSFLKETELPLCTMIIFGSFAKFAATKDSDLDILIISEDEKLDLPFYILPYKIHKIILSKDEVLRGLEKGEPLLMEILSNHIILLNHSFFIDLVWWYYGKKS
jgi:predicted nucleotidyltransferase